MKTKNLLTAAAVIGALAAYPVASHAASPLDDTSVSASKEACGGKDGCKGHDKGEDKDKKKKDKNACAGKDGCGGK